MNDTVARESSFYVCRYEAKLIKCNKFQQEFFVKSLVPKVWPLFQDAIKGGYTDSMWEAFHNPLKVMAKVSVVFLVKQLECVIAATAYLLEKW